VCVQIKAPQGFPENRDADANEVDRVDVAQEFLLNDGGLQEDEYTFTKPKDLYTNFKKLLKNKDPMGSDAPHKIQDDA
jgi:hypothetical protein